MDEDLHHIDDLFHKGLENYHDTPSKAVWEKLDKDLDKRKVIAITKKYAKMKWVAAALLLFSSAIAMYTWNMRSQWKETVVQGDKSDGNPVTPLAPKNQRSSGQLPDSQSRSESIAVAKPSISGVDTINTSKHSEEQSAVGLDNKLRQQAALSRKEHVSLSSRERLRQSSSSNNRLSSKNKINRTFTKNEWSEPKMDRQFETSRSIDPSYLHESLMNDLKVRAKDVAAQLQNKSFKTGQQLNFTPVQITTPTKSKFKIGTYYAFEAVSTRVTNTNNIMRFRGEDKREIKETEDIRQASTIGLTFNYNLNSHLSLGTGLALSSFTTTIKPKLIYARPDNMGNVNYRINCSAGYSVVTVKGGSVPRSGDSIQALTATNTLKYIGIPVNLFYHTEHGKWSVDPGIGIAANLLTHRKIQTEVASAAGVQKASSDQIEGLKPMYFSGNLSLGINYGFSKNVALAIIPQMKLGLSSINENAPVKTLLRTYGIAVGLNVNL